MQISVTNSINKGSYLLTTILNDKNNNKEEAYTNISKDTHPQKEVVSFTMYHLLKNDINQDKERYLREEVSRLSQERLEYAPNQKCQEVAQG